jgi:hypothetical protein
MEPIMSDLKTQSRQALVTEIDTLHGCLNRLEDKIRSIEDNDDRKRELEKYHKALAEIAVAMKKLLIARS